MIKIYSDVFEESPVQILLEEFIYNISRIKTNFEKPFIDISLQLNYLLEMFIPIKESWNYKYDDGKNRILDVEKDKKALEKIENIMFKLYR